MGQINADEVTLIETVEDARTVNRLRERAGVCNTDHPFG